LTMDGQCPLTSLPLHSQLLRWSSEKNEMIRSKVNIALPDIVEIISLKLNAKWFYTDKITSNCSLSQFYKTTLISIRPVSKNSAQKLSQVRRLSSSADAACDPLAGRSPPPPLIHHGHRQAIRFRNHS
jgi:hypothetical protein